MISVDELGAVATLGLTYIAGRSGGARRVMWAHACDLPDPWNWVDSGDLVMTTGGGLPADAEGQCRWVRSLIDHGVSAVVLALRADAPELDGQMLAAADDGGLPMLTAAFDLHFVTLARTVIESAVETERGRLGRIRRLYDLYWQSLHTRGGLGDRLTALEVATGWKLTIDDQSGRRIAGGRHIGESPGVARADCIRQIVIPGALRYTLTATADHPLGDSALLQHVGGLVALDLEHQVEQRNQLRAVGEDLLCGLLDESLTLNGAWPQFRHRGMQDTLVLACWSMQDGTLPEHDAIHLAPDWGTSVPLLVAEQGVLFALLPGEQDLLERITTELGEACRCGVSPVLTVNTSAPEAARQARMALASAHDTDDRVVRYGVQRDSREILFPGTLEDSRQLVNAVLGPLSVHDRSNGGELIDTLRVFLRFDGSSGRAADALHIHRQTLVYRLRKIEKLTGFKPTSTAGASRFWLAFEIAERARFDLNGLS